MFPMPRQIKKGILPRSSRSIHNEHSHLHMPSFPKPSKSQLFLTCTISYPSPIILRHFCSSTETVLKLQFSFHLPILESRYLPPHPVFPNPSPLASQVNHYSILSQIHQTAPLSNPIPLESQLKYYVLYKYTASNLVLWPLQAFSGEDTKYKDQENTRHEKEPVT